MTKINADWKKNEVLSFSDTCLLLALYMYITSRPDKSASEMLWLQLEQEVTMAECPCALSFSFQLGEWEERDSAQIVRKQVLSLAEIENCIYGLAVRDYIDF